jgi:ABC-2 type transport system ATP-binding protein
MPQETALYPGLTVHQNMKFFGEVFGLSREGIQEREVELLEFIGLPEWRDEPVGNLSGGMKHRVSLACAMIHRPPLLLLDEPTVGVDPELRVSFWEYFDHIKREDRTIVITTHYMDEARRCDRIGFMHDGRLIAEGSPDEVLREAGTDDLEDAFMVLAERGEKR